MEHLSGERVPVFTANKRIRRKICEAAEQPSGAQEVAAANQQITAEWD